MNSLNYIFGCLFIFASWANEARFFGGRGGDVFSLLFGAIGALFILVGLIYFIKDQAKSEYD